MHKSTYHDCLCIVDINECQLEIDDCDSNSDCVDTDGSFYCSCHHGYSKELNGITCSMYNQRVWVALLCRDECILGQYKPLSTIF